MEPVPCPMLQFKEVQTAYEILSDSEKREMYDRYGMDGVRESGGGGMGPMSGDGVWERDTNRW